jgi:CRISPR-associated protein Cas1
VTGSAFATTVTLEIDAIYDELRTGRYRPRPLRCFRIHEDGHEREVGIPAMRDRLVQEAIRPVLEAALHPRLSPNCHGYVHGRSVTTAQHAAAAFVATGFDWVHGLDIRDAFGTLDRAILQARLSQLLDERTAAMVALLMAADRDRDGRIQPAAPLGIPLGQPLSPDCFNAYMLPADRALDESGARWVRYADDLLLLGRSEDEIDRALGVLDRALERIRLARKPEKDRRTRVTGDPFTFLGRFLAPGLVLEAVPQPQPRPESDVATVTDADPPARPPWFRTLYLQQYGAFVRLDAAHIVVRLGNEERQRVPLRNIDRIVVMAGVTFSAPVLASCLQRGIPVHFTLVRGRGTAFGSLVRSDAETPLRTRSQLEAYADETFRLSVARSIVRAKILNSRWLLRRWRTGRDPIRRLGLALTRLDRATSLDEVLGFEGSSAVVHFRALGARIPRDLGFTGRTRRPPRDPFNSLLSFGYTLLFTEMHSLLIQHRLNPFIGYLHALRDSHPALASDLIEEFRAPVVDQLCVRIANLRQLRPDDFEAPRANGAVFMKPAARRRFLELWEEHLQAPFCRIEGACAMDARRTMERQVRRILDVILCGSGTYLPFDAGAEHVAGKKQSGRSDAGTSPVSQKGQKPCT